MHNHDAVSTRTVIVKQSVELWKSGISRKNEIFLFQLEKLTQSIFLHSSVEALNWTLTHLDYMFCSLSDTDTRFVWNPSRCIDRCCDSVWQWYDTALWHTLLSNSKYCELSLSSVNAVLNWFRWTRFWFMASVNVFLCPDMLSNLICYTIFFLLLIVSSCTQQKNTFFSLNYFLVWLNYGSKLC